MAAESLDSFKRWREERWDRRADRARLSALSESSARAESALRSGARPIAGSAPSAPGPVADSSDALAPTRRLSRSRTGSSPAPVGAPGNSAPAGRARRAAISRWVRPWPSARLGDLLHGPWEESNLKSPVHPEWDDPGDRRLTRSLFGSLVTNLILFPAVLLVMQFKSPEPSSSIRMKPYVVTFSAPRGNSLAAPRTLAPPTPPPSARPAPVEPSPRVEPPRPETRPPAPPAKVATPPAGATRKPVDEPRTETARAKANDGKRVRETADPKETNPVPAREKGTTTAGDGATRKAAPAGPPAETATQSAAKSQEPPVTEPVARPGPLVASVAGAVAGSELTLGDLDGVNFPHSYYLEQIRDKIAERWGPPEGMARGRQLKAVVRFRILRSGKIGEQVLEEPSGHAVFDQAALRAVTDAQKFGPLPDAFPGAFLVVHFNFTYTSP